MSFCFSCGNDHDGHALAVKNLALTAERDALRAQLADAAKVSDGVWEWVPKPKYDALLAQKCELIERVTRLCKTAEAERQREMGPDTSAVGKMHAYLKVLRLLESDDVLPLKNVAPAVGEEQTSRLREFIGNTVSERFTKDFVREGVLAILESTAAPLHDTKEKE
jgi:hypothetical protein